MAKLFLKSKTQMMFFRSCRIALYKWKHTGIMCLKLLSLLLLLL